MKEETTEQMLSIDYLPCVDYAMSVNGSRYLTRCELYNGTSADWRDLTLRVGGDLFAASEAHVALVPSGSHVSVVGLDLKPDIDRLRQLTESAETLFTVTVSDSDGQLLYERACPIRLLAFDEWPGIGVMPELLSAFVTPNAAEVAPVLVSAARHLERLTGSSALDGYQTQDPNRVRAQVAAVYEALREPGLVYSNPPASFERSGQRIRLIGTLMQQKLGTCADLTLAFASCLEAIGLNPLLCVAEGHLFLACWLVDRHYPQTLCDDVSFLSKSVADGINEMVVVECTCLTERGVSFEDAVATAERRIATDSGQFVMAIDVVRCRMEGIRPLPIDGTATETDGLAVGTATDSVKQQQSYDLHTDDGRQLSRQQLWERKLLDFSLRNNLLNLRLGKKVVPFVSFDIDQIEDHLQAKSDIQILPLPSGKAIAPDDSGMYHSRVQGEALEAVVTDGVRRNQLYSYWNESELTTALKGLFRLSRTALEENGANTLFLCLGLLKWYETDKSVKPRYAPLLLEPVDIVKKSGNHYVLRMRDEDLTFNTTLVEMLRQQYEVNIAGVSPLPTDESGADVRRVFSLVRAAVKDHARWDVVEECLLGIFSFSKFVMWNDIHNNADKMRQNPIIESLIQKRLVDMSTPAPTDTRAVDRQVRPANYAIPVDVDSSQLEAVIESGEGRSFILYGPPGTGKSQTITNMIANALYHDKRVLFVAEKMAALEVVQRRLAKVGLAPFCLEMHSNKANKSHLLGQLQTALDITRLKTTEEYAQESERLFAQRQQLVEQVELLHSPQPTGLSLYDYISRYLSYPTDDALAPTEKMLQGIDAGRIATIEQAITALAPVLDLVGTPTQHPLYGLDIHDPSYETQQKTATLAQAIQPLLPAAKAYVAALADANGLTLPLTVDGLSTARQLAALLAAPTYINAATLALASDTKRRDYCLQVVATGRRRDAAAATLSARYTPQTLQADPQALKAEWTAANDKWLVSGYFAKRDMLRRLKAYRADITAEEVPTLIAQLEEYHTARSAVAAQQGALASVFGPLAQAGHEQWNAMEHSLRQADAVLSLLAATGQATADYIPPVDSAATQRLNPTALQRLCAMLQEAASWCSLDGAQTLDEAASRCEAWATHTAEARDWAQWCLRRRDLCEQGMAAAVAHLEEGYTTYETRDAVLRGLYRHLAMKVIDGDQRLQLFNGSIFEDQVERYRDMARQFQDITKKALYCRLASRIPSVTAEAASGSEMGILKRYINSGGRGASIRHIIDQVPTLLPKLCPCMLMSPISVAQYIDLDQEKFDIVVFDEASQMPTSEAIGAIARGKALIVVGDPKQMPPTSFFATTQVDESEADEDDMESILDDCITLSLPDHYLTWHYRSRHESLIAFSNSQYYDGKLYTFPSVDDRASRVRLVPVEGTYDMGRTRSNHAEAEAIVGEVVRRLSHPQLSKQSIGVVSFSKVQQDLIEDILVDELAKQPALERLAYDSAEPIFVKNLENVQGDERDVILFSVGYGPDKYGKVSMNFGPLNNQGGERRLNVAVSRARCEMVVFSTLQPEQIDLNRSRARGVEGLKRFLEFARTGRMPVAASQVTDTRDDTQVVESVALALRQRGYQVDTLVGRSRFKVDIAVVDPSDSEGYAMGIMTDGTRYYLTPTERDREICQPGVLKGLGWNLQRVWTLDWMNNPDRVLARLLQQLERKADKREDTAATAMTATATTASKAAATADTTVPTETTDTKEAAATAERAARLASLPFTVRADEVVTPQGDPHAVAYRRVTLQPVLKVLNAGMLTMARRQLRTAIEQIVATEQPVTLATLCKRIPQLFETGRMTPQISEGVKELAMQTAWLDPRSPIDNPVFWTDAHAAESYDSYRVASDRDDDEIPQVEWVVATRVAMEQSLSAPIEAVKKQVSHLMGFQRKRAGVYQAIQEAIDLLARQGTVSVEGDVVRLAK